jgi:hypothetical protein
VRNEQYCANKRSAPVMTDAQIDSARLATDQRALSVAEEFSRGLEDDGNEIIPWTTCQIQQLEHDILRQAPMGAVKPGKQDIAVRKGLRSLALFVSL